MCSLTFHVLLFRKYPIVSLLQSSEQVQGLPGLYQWKSAVRLVEALSGKKTALTGIMDV